jgi:chromatin segregation and condensation protein Rec8/ScpA/Scc1 (kleisin family)
VSSGLVSSLSYLITISYDKELMQIILSSDIINDIKIIKNFLDENNIKNIENKTVIECINDINDTLKNLETIIKNITDKIEYNKSLWFSYFRTYNLQQDREELKILITQLEHRFNLLIKFYSITK